MGGSATGVGIERGLHPGGRGGLPPEGVGLHLWQWADPPTQAFLQRGWTETPPVDRQTPVKTLPCPKFIIVNYYRLQRSLGRHPTSGTAAAADGTLPTGMHSCLNYFCLFCRSINNILQHTQKDTSPISQRSSN